MDTGMNGKAAQFIEWNGGDQYRQVGKNCDALELSATYHGDHDEFWIVEKRSGQEIARFNCRHLAQIIWAESSPPAHDGDEQKREHVREIYTK